MKLLKALSEYRWPLFLTGFLVMSITANAVLVYVATRPDAPKPIEGYYEQSKNWDEDSALRAASAQLGWKVSFDIPKGEHYLAGMPRPVDVRVVGRDGKPVTGLVGRLRAMRPSDRRSTAAGSLTELPHAPGSYRTLVALDAPGLWELSVDARRGGQRFVHSRRVSFAATLPKGGGGA